MFFAALRRRLIDFAANSRAIAAVEFALVLPLLVLILLGGSETSRMLAFQRHVINYTNGMAFDLAGSTSQITAAQMYNMTTQMGILVPELADGEYAWPATFAANNRFMVGFTMVVMTPTVAGCINNCTYTANVAWSWGAMPRPCGVLTSASNTASYSATTLPAGAFQPGAVMVVDVQAVYPVTFASRFMTGFTLVRSAYYPVRNYTAGVYPPTDNFTYWWTGAKCNGYP